MHRRKSTLNLARAFIVSVSKWLCERRLVQFTVVLALAVSPALSQSGIADPALAFVNQLVSANRSKFAVYEDSDSGLNHGFPSGWFPGGPVLSKIHLGTACVYDSASPSGCATDTSRIDQTRGTVMRVTFDPLAGDEFVGINIEEPENFGVDPRGIGYDLRGAASICFDAASPTPTAANFKVQFAVAQHSTAFLSIPSQWTQFCYDLSSLGLTSSDLSQVHFLFTIVSNSMNAGSGGTILLDNIHFSPVPSAQGAAISFPLANQVVGVIPAPEALTGRVPIPPDQVLANLTTTYESAIAAIALLSTGNPQDAYNARAIADAFLYALGHENQGDPLPLAPDGSAGLHNAMFSGDLPLFNDQGPGQGHQRQVRLSGFSISSNLCGPTHFCLVLDGATGGNNAFAILALLSTYERFQDEKYLNAAKEIGNWIYGNLLDRTGTGFGGYYVGYPDEGQAKQLQTGKSVENNADIFSAFSALGRALQARGLNTEATEWNQRAKIAGDFVMQMFEPSAGRFYAGTVPPSVPRSPGISPNGPAKGNDVVNTFDFEDAGTFVTLALAGSPLYRNAIDWHRPIEWILNNFAQSVTAAGQQYEGFDLVAQPTAGPNGIAWEFTGQAVVAMRFIDGIYGDATFESAARSYLAQIHHAQQTSPFADGSGIVAATLQGGDQVLPYEQCLSTPFQCIAERIGLAATTWSILGDLNVNPFPNPSPSSRPVFQRRPPPGRR